MSTNDTETTVLQNKDQSLLRTLLNWAFVFGFLYMLLVGVGTIGSGFKYASLGKATELFELASNPLVGLIIGAVATALVQSSSTVTSIVVVMVAASEISVGVAVPIVMGANIGTTVTNTIVSLGYVSEKEEFKRAFAAATVHDFFNLLSVVIFLPLELAFGFLEKSAGYLSTIFLGEANLSLQNVNYVKAATKPIITGLKEGLSGLFVSKTTVGIWLAVIGLVFVFVAIIAMGRLLKKMMSGWVSEVFHKTIGRNAISGIATGAIVTTMVQSSSTTTSLIIPFAGNGIFTLKEIYPFTLGANIGTCVTALLAATGVATNSEAALQIALVHLLYNSIGVIVIYGIPFLRNIPLVAAEKLADVAAERKVLALVYILTAFFVLPGGVLAIAKMCGA